MAYFKDAQEIYDSMGTLFRELMVDAELAPQFKQANTVVQYRYNDPPATITVKMLEGQDAQVDCGATELDCELVLTMDADLAHRFWLGQVNITVALARGQVKASGPVSKLLKLVPLAKLVYPRYRAQLEAGGREDLIVA